MEARIQAIGHNVQACLCGNQHYEMKIDQIEIGTGMLKQAADYIVKQAWKHVVIVADANTYRAAGAALEQELKQRKVDCPIVLLQPDGNDDVLANEMSIVQAMLETPLDTAALLAVGIGHHPRYYAVRKL